jgi:hypothetical protein
MFDSTLQDPKKESFSFTNGFGKFINSIFEKRKRGELRSRNVYKKK